MKEKWFRALLRKRFSIVLLLIAQLAVIAYTLISRSLSSKITAAALSLLSLAVCLYIISRRDKGAFKLSWVFMIMLFPIFGGLFYLAFKAQSSSKRVVSRIRSVAEKTRSFGRVDSEDAEHLYSKAPQYAPLVRYLSDTAGFSAYAGAEAEYLSPGEKFYERLLSELQKAESYIFLEFFILQEGQMWNSILDILIKKAASGVKVRLIYDDVGCFLKLPSGYEKTLRSRGIDCLVFNPFRPVLTSLQNNRDHRKIAVIDGKTAFTGGVNLADEYINAVERFGHWKDAGLMVKGEAAWSFTLMFLGMWELLSGSDEDYMQYRPQYTVTGDCFVQPWADSPNDSENVGEHVYLHMINRARRYLYITTPYLIIDDSMVSALILAAKSGVDVRIICPCRWDKRLVHMTTRSYYRELIDGGVKIYEYTKGFIHSKTFLCDGDCANIGTTNLDFRSLYLHYECGAWLYGGSAVKALETDFLDTLAVCRQIAAEDCRCGVIKKLFQEILRLFAPLM